jgi:hypothetical protein
VAVNGDFSADHGSYALGPLVWEGISSTRRRHRSRAGAGARPQRRVGPSRARFALQSADGSGMSLQGVNDIPGENAASLFNAYWDRT